MNKPTVQDIFHRFYPAYIERYSPSPEQAKAARNIINCKTGAYGANVSICEDCGAVQIHYNSCRNRCCPMCQAVPKEKWMDARREDMLDAPYFHLVFTVPNLLNPVIYSHSEFRILHHKDNTGAEIQDSLIKAVQRHPNITVIENQFAIEILTQHHLGVTVTRQTPDIKCYGAYILDPKTGKVDTYLAKVTLMATGGVGAVYKTTTNPLVATGDGIAMVYRAKGTVKDMEFVQFHPTALYHPGDRPSFLITEAMRGYGGVLRTMDGKEFMQKYDPRLSLAPRDIVARAIDNEMRTVETTMYIWTSPTKIPKKQRNTFPNIYEKCLSLGIDITKIISGSPGRPLSLRRYPCRPGRTIFHRTSLCRGRMFLHRIAWRQPPGFQLTDRSSRICRRCRQT